MKFIPLIGSNWACPVCGAVVWVEHQATHEAWHAALEARVAGRADTPGMTPV